MKKNGILNSHISKVLSDMGHTDTITIADCGLPISNDVQKIDLAISHGKPSFLEVLDALMSDMVIEEITLAEEIKSKNEDIYNEIRNRFPDVKINYLSHEDFKKNTLNSNAIVRTGEVTPYANVILHSGVVF